MTTGGTIAMLEDPETGAPVPALSGDDLVAAVPALEELASIRMVEFSNITSSNMGPDRWPDMTREVEEALQDSNTAGVVITHGTDAIEETAFFLDVTLQSDKPVVLVGALRSASDADADGPRNITNAVRQILSEDASGKGVSITMNHYIHGARAATKSHVSNVDGFSSGEYGYLGYVDDDRVVFYRQPLRRQTLSLPDGDLPRVDVIAMYSGADGSYVRHAVEDGAEGIVIQAFGWGSVSEAMYDEIENAIAEGLKIVISTRVPHGRTLPIYGYKGGGATLKELGAIFADDLSPGKAQIMLMLAMAEERDHEELRAIFSHR
ncbi:asparaginase [Halomonas mongoliensis]|uniref:asparaginase n=1 Tax=Halomonas mongoliensis TaxID=321265 RepID=UPI00403ACBD2